jgi:hypothetical protein
MKVGNSDPQSWGDKRMATPDEPQEFERMPGLFRSWELYAVLSPGHEYRIEQVDAVQDGTVLLAIYRSIQRDDQNQPLPPWWSFAW